MFTLMALIAFAGAGYFAWEMKAVIKDKTPADWREWVQAGACGVWLVSIFATALKVMFT